MKNRNLGNLYSTALLVLSLCALANPLASRISAQSEERPTSPEAPTSIPVVPPVLLPPSEEINATNVDSNDSIESQYGNAFAVIDDIPSGLQGSISFQEFEASPETENSTDVAFSIQSVTTYSGDEGEVVISLSTLSQGASGRSLHLGDAEVDENVTRERGVFLTTDLPGDLPNQVRFRRGQSIVTIVSNLPPEELVSISKKVRICNSSRG